MNKRLVQIALTLALGLFLVQVVLIAPSRIRDTEQKAALLPTPEMNVGPHGEVDQTMRGMHMIETQEGRKDWELWADQAISLKAQDRLKLMAVKAVFFSSEGVTFTVTGKMGMVDVKTKDLKIEGDVVTRSSNGYVFRTESVQYKSDERMLSTPDAVEMLGPRDGRGFSLRLRGQGMEASISQSTMTVLNNVRADRRLTDGRRVQIQSQQSIFSGQDRTARFLGDVVLDLEGMRITGPEARLQYDPQRKMLKSMTFDGETRVSDAEKWATARHVMIDLVDNKYVFRGRPRVVQGQDELRGEEIVFLDGGKRVHVQRARARVDNKQLEKVN